MLTWNRIKNMRLHSMAWLAFSILPLTAACQAPAPEESVDAEVEDVDTQAEEASAARPIKACGGLLGLQCAKDEYCEYTRDAMCGAADQPGVCKPLPKICTEQYRPVCGCDGNTYANVCKAHAAGVSVAYQGRCAAPPPPSDVCGVRGAPECAKGEFCDFPLDSMCGAADQPGKCTDIPEICTKEYRPVCGCDGNTYSNACMANAAGVSVSSLGACDTPPDPSEQACGGLLGLQCDRGEFCNYPLEAMCGAFDQTGVCETIPQACTFIYDPVCGCDGNTYSNECMANAAGVSVSSRGECAPAPGQICGGLAGIACAKGEFCNYPLDAMCGAADQTGTCERIPGACTLQYDPVCGCDDRTYGNACEAHMAGVSVASEGPCRAQY